MKHDPEGVRATGLRQPPFASLAALRFQWPFALLGAGLVLGVLVLHRFDPATHAFYPRCQFHELTGLHCPGCGSQRAVYALVHADLARAVRCNALLVLGLPVLGLVWLGRWRRRMAGDTPPLPLSVSPRWWWICAGIAGLFTVLRNLPFAPFTWLAP